MTIVAMLLALSLPAIQSVRERSRITTCQNRLRQIGLANHQHEVDHRFFAAGGWGARWMGVAKQGFGSDQPGGWAFDLLGYLGAGPIREIIHAVPTSATVRLAAESLPAVMACPSRNPAMEMDASDHLYFDQFSVEHFRRNDFACNSGSNQLITIDGPLPGQSVSRFYRDIYPHRGNGVVHYYRPYQNTDLLDGLSKTLFAAEKWVGTSLDDHGSDQPAWTGGSLDTFRYTKLGPVPDSMNNAIYASRFGSRHSAGINAVFCDGSTATIAYTVDPVLFAAMGNRQDREVAQSLY